MKSPGIKILLRNIIKLTQEKSSRNCKSFRNLITGENRKKMEETRNSFRNGLHIGGKASKMWNTMILLYWSEVC